MDVGAGLYMYDVVVKKFTFAISSPDEFLVSRGSGRGSYAGNYVLHVNSQVNLLVTAMMARPSHTLASPHRIAGTVD